MTITFFLKGLSPEDRLFPQTIESSVKLAKGTLYEAWFETLQTSPWYCDSCETGNFKSLAAEEAWRKFGDLRGVDFSKWWKLRGYEIFAEKVPYQPIEISQQQIKTQSRHNGKQPPTLRIDVPLNLHPSMLRKQFEEILRQHSYYYLENKNRWDHSTAEVHQYRETKLTYQTITHWLKVYKAYAQQKDRKEFRLYNFSRDLKLHPVMFRGLLNNVDVPEDLRVEASNVASDILKQVQNLMAHATELRFPCTDPHTWNSKQTRLKKLP